MRHYPSIGPHNWRDMTWAEINDLYAHLNTEREARRG